MATIDFTSVDGKRSSQTAGRAILSEAVATIDPSAAADIRSAKDWRKGYIPHFRAAVAAGVRSPKHALALSESGLDALGQQVVAEGAGGEVPLRSTLAKGTPFATDILEGDGERSTKVIVPLRGKNLEGNALVEQLESWVAKGTIEPSARDAVLRVMQQPEWLDLSDLTVVMLGAASEMGPVEQLTAWGATVVAIDLPRERVWERIDGAGVAGSGRVLRPMTDGRPGVDLLAQLDDVAAWLDELEGPFVLGNYVYADGANFVRLAAATDALVAHLAESGKLQAYAYLATPTDVYAVPEEVTKGATSRGARKPVASVIGGISRGALYGPHYRELIEDESGSRWGLADSLVPIQGANYALAKQMQRWRAIATHNAGITTSANVAPATRTISVTKNRMLAAAYRAAHNYRVEVFEPETSRALMALLLVHDLRNKDAVASNPDDVAHPYDLFVNQASHGGLWRSDYEPRSVLPIALLRGLFTRDS